MGIAGSRVKRSGGGAYDPEDAPLQQFRWPERERERERESERAREREREWEGGREGGREGESMCVCMCVCVGVCVCVWGGLFVCALCERVYLCVALD